VGAVETDSDEDPAEEDELGRDLKDARAKEDEVETDSDEDPAEEDDVATNSDRDVALHEPPGSTEPPRASYLASPLAAGHGVPGALQSRSVTSQK
jgi:hypothetical protein